MNTRISLPVLSTLFLCAIGLSAQSGGGSTPPPAPAIAFSEKAIKVMNADGTNARTVVSLRRGEAADAPVWSPNGQQLAFTAVLGGVQGLWRVNLDGTGRQFLAPQLAPQQIGSMRFVKDWSRGLTPDGREKIAFLSNGVGGFADVFVVNTDGTGLQNLTNSPEDEMSVSWTRDGQGLYVGWTDWNLVGMPPFPEGCKLLHLSAALGGGIQVTTVSWVLDYWWVEGCAVAHGSDRVLVRGVSSAAPGNTPLIYLVAAPNTTPWTTQLLNGTGQIFRTPSFSPDDQRIVYQRAYSTLNGIYVAYADCSNPIRIRSSGEWPSWRHN